MKIKTFILPLILVTGLILTSCGYRSPFVYSGPDINIYITSWHNRTNELLLDAKIYQSLVKWYQKSGAINVSKAKEGAQLILAGEIISIDLPSLTFGSANSATEVKVLLTVRYVLKNIESGKILIEVGRETLTEDYKVGLSSSESADNEKEALATIIETLSQKIYIKSLEILSKQQ